MSFGTKTNLEHVKRYQGDSVPIAFRVQQKKCDSNKVQPLNITGWSFQLVIDHGFEDISDNVQVSVIDGVIENPVEGLVNFPYTMVLPLNRQFYYTVKSVSDTGQIQTHGLGVISAMENIAYLPPEAVT